MASAGPLMRGSGRRLMPKTRRPGDFFGAGRNRVARLLVNEPLVSEAESATLLAGASRMEGRTMVLDRPLE